MEYVARSGNIAKVRTQCVVAPVFADGELSETAATLNKASQGQIRKIINRGDITGKSGQSLLLHDVANISAQRVLLIGFGDPESADTARFMSVTRALTARMKSLSVRNATCCPTDMPCAGRSILWRTQRLVEQFESGTYSYLAMKGTGVASDNPQEQPKLTVVDLFSRDKEDIESINRGIDQGLALAHGIKLARDVANAPANVCNPTYLAEQARQLADRYESMTVSVLGEDDMAGLGMGAFLSVCRGSEQPGKMITIEYQGTDADTRPHAIIGKGITFDSGGISLKSGAGMHEMIYDMCGAASVLGTMATIAEQGSALNVVGVMAAAENMPSASATRPGDIVTTMSGQTVEIINTDAEGRLVLCDALTYVGKFDPVSVVDIATLTGACVTALGSVATGLFSNDDQLAGHLAGAGEQAFDRIWRLPIWEEYQPQLASAFADVANVGGKEAGSITGACFLARFAKNYRWAHLDIAGTAYQGSGAGKGYSGRPIPLLTQYLLDRADESPP